MHLLQAQILLTYKDRWWHMRILNFYTFIILATTGLSSCGGAPGFEGTTDLNANANSDNSNNTTDTNVCTDEPPACNLFTSCTPSYPYMSSTPATKIPFNESDILQAMTVSGSTSQQVRV